MGLYIGMLLAYKETSVLLESWIEIILLILLLSG